MNEELKARTSARIQSTKRSLFQRIARILTHRLFFDVLFMLVQIAVLAVMILAFSQYFTYFYGICILLTVLAVIAIIAKPSHPDYKIAWIVPILLFPIFGGMFYLLLGGVILGLLSRVWTQEVTLDAQTVMGILLIGVVGTAMAFTLYLQGVNDIGPVKTSLLSCAELVTAGVLTSVWLKTPLAWQDVLGMALILGMVAFLAVPGRTTPNTTRSNS